MTSETQGRDLTTLELVILGFMAIKPQSGYDIINYLETGLYRLSASTGSIYPVLKRLENARLISSTLEAVYETRPRKVYTLRPEGQEILVRWLRAAPTMSEVIEEYDIAMHKFLIMEYCLTHLEIVAWLKDYLAIIQAALSMRMAFENITRDRGGLSRHAYLVNQSIVLEIQARLSWTHSALASLEQEPS